MAGKILEAQELRGFECRAGDERKESPAFRGESNFVSEYLARVNQRNLISLQRYIAVIKIRQFDI